MARATVGRLNVFLNADPSGLLKGLDRAASALDKTGKKLEGIGRKMSKNVTAPLAALGAAALGSAVRIGNVADQLLDLSQQTGLTTDSLQEFRRVAVVAGVGADTIADAAQKLNMRLKATGDESKETVDAFAMLGVATRDSSGQFRDMDAMLPEIIEKLRGIENTTQRNTLATQIFGRGASALLPVLGLTGEAFDAARAEAHELGLVLSGDSLKAANDFRIQWDTLKQTMMGVVTNLGVAVIPTMSKLVDVVQKKVVPAVQKAVDWVTQIDTATLLWVAGVAAAVAAIGPMLLIVGKLSIAFGLLLSPIGLVIAAVTILAASAAVFIRNWDVIKLWSAQLWNSVLRTFITGSQAVLAAIQKVAVGIPVLEQAANDAAMAFTDWSVGALQRSGESLRRLEGDLNRAGVATANLTEEVVKANNAAGGGGGGGGANKLRAEIDKVTAALDQSLRTSQEMGMLLGSAFDEGQAEASAYRQAVEALVALGVPFNETLDAQGRSLANLSARYLAQTTAINEATEAEARQKEIRQEVNGLLAAAMTPTERYEAAIARLNVLMAQKNITDEEFVRLSAHVTKAYEDASGGADKLARMQDDLANSFASSLMNITTDFKRMAQSLLADMARIIARALIMRAVLSFLSPGAGIGGSLFTAFGGKVEPRAMGGPVNAGQSYLVGERGPELITPRHDGMVHSAADTAQMGGQSITINVPPAQDPITMANDQRWLRALHDSFKNLESNGLRAQPV